MAGGLREHLETIQTGLSADSIKEDVTDFHDQVQLASVSSTQKTIEAHQSSWLNSWFISSSGSKTRS